MGLGKEDSAVTLCGDAVSLAIDADRRVSSELGNLPLSGDLFIGELSLEVRVKGALHRPATESDRCRYLQVNNPRSAQQAVRAFVTRSAELYFK